MEKQKIKFLMYAKNELHYRRKFWNKTQAWFKLGKLHNENGPAHIDEKEQYYFLNGFEYRSRNTWMRALRKLWKK